MSAATIILLQMRRIVQAFRTAGAIHPGASIIPAQYNIRQSFAFNKLLRRGVLVAVGENRYYMNEEAEARYRKQRQMLMLIVMAVLALVLVMTLIFSK